jgi:glycerol kinase
MADARPVVLGIDQGTSSTKVLAVDGEGTVIATGHASVAQSHPTLGWVEQSGTEIWESVRTAVADCVDSFDPRRVAAVGLSTQRESLVAWDRDTGTPLGPVLGWQDRRSSDICSRLLRQGAARDIRGRTGLPVDPMFSAAKAAWVLDDIDPDRRRSKQGKIKLGTVDSWLLSRFGGRHLTEIGNASRTQLFHIRNKTWDPELMELFGVPEAALPEVVSSIGPFPAARGLSPLPDGVPVTGVAGDSHAAFFANCGWRSGRTKVTYGTGTSVMASAGNADPGDALCLTIAWDTGDATYALEGNIRSSGATIRWLADLLGTSPDELAALAQRGSSDGVHIVPAFTGLGAPWWDNQAAGLIEGLTPGSGPAALARAAFEAVCFQVEDVVAAVEARGGPVSTLLADGGGSVNPFLMQLQANTSGRVIEASQTADLSALGAVHLAGLGASLWDMNWLDAQRVVNTTFRTSEGEASRKARVSSWHKAVARCRWRDGTKSDLTEPWTSAPYGVADAGRRDSRTR